MSTRVSPLERSRADIDELFASERDLGEVLEEVRAGARDGRLATTAGRRPGPLVGQGGAVAGQHLRRPPAGQAHEIGLVAAGLEPGVGEGVAQLVFVPTSAQPDLRHTYPAFCIASTADPYAVMRRMGHSSITVTYNTYGHLFPERDEEITNRLEDLSRRSGVDSSWTRPGAPASVSTLT